MLHSVFTGMQIGAWSEPVLIRIGGPGGATDNVDSALEAIQVLVHQWPVHGGALHAEALAICFDVVDGNPDIEAARAAFIAAAEEADILA